MKLVSLSNLEAQNSAHGFGIAKKAMLNNGDIPCVSQFAQAVFKVDEKAGAHVHPDMWEVFLVNEGSGLAVIDGKDVPLEPGVSVTVEPGEEHDFRNTGAEDLVMTYFGVVPQSDTRDAEYWRERLNLQPHPEGGWFKEVFRAGEMIPEKALPDRFDNDRVFATHIYFLLTDNDFSAFHRIKSDELWHFYAGNGLTVHVLRKDGVYSSFHMGRSAEDWVLQATVPAESWFAAEVTHPNGYALVGCTVSPGFEYQDFEIAECDQLCDLHSDHGELIKRLTRGKE